MKMVKTVKSIIVIVTAAASSGGSRWMFLCRWRWCCSGVSAANSGGENRDGMIVNKEGTKAKLRLHLALFFFSV